MADQLIFLQLKSGQVKLNKPFTAGSTIYFLSTAFDGTPEPGPKLDNTSVNLRHGDDYLLHISIRRVEKRIYFNTFRNGAWDKNPQAVNLENVFSGPGAVIKVKASDTSYEISFDESPTVHTFKKRINGDATTVSYGIENQRPVFSNPIIAQIFYPRTSGVFISSIPF